jgi:hypothetical protein
MGVTYDTGALIAAERNDRSMWALHRAQLEDGEAPTVPAPVLAQAWRGGSRQAHLARLLQSCVVEPLSADLARSVGALAGVTGHDDIVDLAVAEGARRRRDIVITSDPADLAAIADWLGATLELVTV